MLIFIPALTLYCPTRSQLHKFSSSNSSPVNIGYYPKYHHPLPPYHPLNSRISALRQDIEAHENLLRQLVREHYDVKSPLEFRFSYAGLDSAHSRLVIRYFAPAFPLDKIAGWQVQLIYSLPKLTLTSLYVWAVPLE